MVTYSNILAWRILMDRGAWKATVHGVTKSQTRLKQLSSSSMMGTWVSLVAQLVRNLPTIQETPVQFLGQKNPLEKE